MTSVIIWLFMLWRLQNHANPDQLIDDIVTAFPDLLRQLEPDDYYSPEKRLGVLIESRFIERFLQFWGFVTVDPKRFASEDRKPPKVQLQPLLAQTFQFTL
ncbi:hypothetical protein L6J37_09880 [Photobacterium sp. WH77]|uniref:hypothetical protein n=1 Tax=Photobacterium TaxID=657 RepID=UPI001EDB7B2C|nr:MULTISPECIES: hypothetical protein [Photobacterium]MCG2837140.1 hypothetical protein [Photobacterium sp. WH77]MCG2844710.1 hypothetical protein [Photobacterium sp. WH80]